MAAAEMSSQRCPESRRPAGERDTDATVVPDAPCPGRPTAMSPPPPRSVTRRCPRTAGPRREARLRLTPGPFAVVSLRTPASSAVRPAVGLTGARTFDATLAPGRLVAGGSPKFGCPTEVEPALPTLPTSPASPAAGCAAVSRGAGEVDWSGLSSGIDTVPSTIGGLCSTPPAAVCSGCADVADADDAESDGAPVESPLALVAASLSWATGEDVSGWLEDGKRLMGSI